MFIYFENFADSPSQLTFVSFYENRIQVFSQQINKTTKQLDKFSQIKVSIHHSFSVLMIKIKNILNYYQYINE
jgi:rRNA processing protein Krr1/Pno1